MSESFGPRVALIIAGIICAAICLCAAVLIGRVRETRPATTAPVPEMLAGRLEPAAARA
jgi:hypothetical protein